MFGVEYLYARVSRRSTEKGRWSLFLNSQRQWRPHEDAAEGVELSVRSVYAQNEVYLEVCNPAWEQRWKCGFGLLGVVGLSFFVILIWYGLAVHPIFTGNVFYLIPLNFLSADKVEIIFGWVFVFPLALGSVFLIYGWLFGMGMGAAFFSYLRGRIRFNRHTRKVYVLRPSYCGGNKIFDWDRLSALMHRASPKDSSINEIASMLTLYHAPLIEMIWTQLERTPFLWGLL